MATGPTRAADTRRGPPAGIVKRKVQGVLEEAIVNGENPTLNQGTLTRKSRLKSVGVCEATQADFVPHGCHPSSRGRGSMLYAPAAGRGARAAWCVRGKSAALEALLGELILEDLPDD